MSNLIIINGIKEVAPASLVKYTNVEKIDQCGRSEHRFTLEGYGTFPVEINFQGFPDGQSGQAEGWIDSTAVFKNDIESKGNIHIQQYTAPSPNTFIKQNYNLVLNGVHDFWMVTTPTEYAVRPSTKNLAFLQCDNPYGDSEVVETMTVFSTIGINFLDKDLTVTVNNSSLKYF